MKSAALLPRSLETRSLITDVIHKHSSSIFFLKKKKKKLILNFGFQNAIVILVVKQVTFCLLKINFTNMEAIVSIISCF